MYSSSGSLSFGATKLVVWIALFLAAKTLRLLLLSTQIFYQTFS
jgi:hypothetical protein